MLWRIDAVVGKLECTMMDSNARMRTEYLVRSDRLRGIHVNRRHEPPWIVGADRQQRETRRTEPLANLPEMITESGVPGKISCVFLSLDHVSTPKSSVA